MSAGELSNLSAEGAAEVVSNMTSVWSTVGNLTCKALMSMPAALGGGYAGLRWAISCIRSREESDRDSLRIGNRVLERSLAGRMVDTLAPTGCAFVGALVAGTAFSTIFLGDT